MANYKRNDLLGKRFGRLVVIDLSGPSHNRNYSWNCKCDCGNLVNVSSSSLIRGRTKSCGCLRKEVSYERSKKHGMTNTRFYTIWDNMKQRCVNPNRPDFSRYGGRGITVCGEWLNNFWNFYSDMHLDYITHVEQFGEANTTLDRIDNDGDYSKKNCRWATISEQNKNQRPYERKSSLYIPVDSESMLRDFQGGMVISEVCKKYGVSRSTYYNKTRGYYRKLETANG